MKEHKKLLISLVLGIVLGTFFHEHQDIAVINWFQSNVLYLIGQGFLRLIFMIVVPMVFSAMILGIYELISTDNFGRVAKRTLLFTVLASSLAVTIGILIVNILKPGVGAGLKELLINTNLDQVSSIQNAASATKSIRDTLLDMIPSNPLLAASNALNGEMLAFMMFTVLFGIAFAFVSRGKAKQPIFINLMEEIYEATMKIVAYVLKLAPYAIFSIIFQTSYKLGVDFLLSVFFYVFCKKKSCGVWSLEIYLTWKHECVQRSSSSRSSPLPPMTRRVPSDVREAIETSSSCARASKLVALHRFAV